MRRLLALVAVAGALAPTRPALSDRRRATVLSASFSRSGYTRAVEDGPAAPAVDEAEVDALLAQRVSFKKKRLFDKADRLRDRLAVEYGVAIWDKDRVWTTGAKTPTQRTPILRHPSDDAALDGAALEDISRRILARADAQRRKDFGAADEFRDFLREAYAVEINDREKVWKVQPGGPDERIERPYVRAARSAPLADEDDADEVLELVNARGEAKRERRYEEADAIRDELADDFNVIINDKTREWSVGASPFEKATKFDRPYARRGADGGLSAEAAAMVAQAVAARDDAKKKRNFRLADEIRDKLREKFKVDVDDGHREWRVVDAGRRAGSEFVLAWDSAVPEDQDAVIALIEKRGDAKRSRMYDVADQLREDLLEVYGVQVDDRLHEYLVVDPATTKATPKAAAKARAAADKLVARGAADAAKEADADGGGEADDLLAVGLGLVEAYAAANAGAPPPEGAAAPEAATTGAPPSEAGLSALTVPALKAELKARGLKVGGKKAELVARLLDSDSEA